MNKYKKGHVPENHGLVSRYRTKQDARAEGKRPDFEFAEAKQLEVETLTIERMTYEDGHFLVESGGEEYVLSLHVLGKRNRRPILMPGDMISGHIQRVVGRSYPRIVQITSIVHVQKIR